MSVNNNIPLEGNVSVQQTPSQRANKKLAGHIFSFIKPLLFAAGPIGATLNAKTVEKITNAFQQFKATLSSGLEKLRSLAGRSKLNAPKQNLVAIKRIAQDEFSSGGVKNKTLNLALKTATQEIVKAGSQLDSKLVKQIVKDLMSVYTLLDKTPAEMINDLSNAINKSCKNKKTLNLIECYLDLHCNKVPKSGDYTNELNEWLDKASTLKKEDQVKIAEAVISHFIYESGSDHLGETLKQANEAREKGLALLEMLNGNDDLTNTLREKIANALLADLDDFNHNETLTAPREVPSDVIPNSGVVVVLDSREYLVLSKDANTLSVKPYRAEGDILEINCPAKMKIRMVNPYNRQRVNDDTDKIRQTALEQYEKIPRDL